jgi:prepilin-type N-terminal cleavage/methylation domain-containing protein
MKRNQKGFTLIELLVVIAIIGILAAVVLVNVSAARNRARESAVRQAVSQFRILFEEENNTNGNYSRLWTVPEMPSGWASTAGNCDSLYGSSSVRDKARELCKAIIRDASYWVYPFSGNEQQYSMIIAPKSGQNFEIFCVGSSGAITTTGVNTSTWTNPGCPSNP